ncbi:MAG TPA: diphosphomevalonate decarboxylase [bacterium]|nr:diphosphomevalonate decarboxylase [bacterium]
MTKFKKVTARAPANIALVKYWGKRDEELILPQNSSISVCLSELYTETSVEFDADLTADEVLFASVPLQDAKRDKVIKHLDNVREMAGIAMKARVASTATFPMSAGLASSASGFAALSLAASRAAGLNLSECELSILARRGSGSASRSIPDGFTKWKKGEQADGSDSFACSIQSPEMDWGFRMVIPVITLEEKKVSSRTGMAQSVATSPYYSSWLETVADDLAVVEQGILDKDFEAVAQRAEISALKMHALMQTTQPPIIYWTARTVELIHFVHALRDQGLLVYLTMDAGPQVKIMCQEKDLGDLRREIEKLEGIEKLFICKPSRGAEVI